jgi:uncharacterized protein
LQRGEIVPNEVPAEPTVEPNPASDESAGNKSAARVAPVELGERIDDIDVLRGFALFGVLYANGMSWFRTNPLRETLTPERWPGAVDRFLAHAQSALVEMKFITLFSFLFGVGMAIQAERAEAKGGRPIRFLLRRMFFLFLIGAAHVLLLWMGDILHTYALMGFLTLIFIRRKTRTIAIASGVLFGLPIVGTIVRTIIKISRDQSAVPDQAEFRDELMGRMNTQLRVYSEGSWLEIARQRIDDSIHHLAKMPAYVHHIFALFLLGALAHRSGILRDPSAHLRFLRRFIVVALVVGFGLQILFAFRPDAGLKTTYAYVYSTLLGAFFIVHTAVGLAYGAGLLLLLRRPRVRAALAPIGKIGRMALTNYLAQSVILSIVFYGFGFRLHDKLSPKACLPILIALYAIQVAWSRAWLARFRYGPVEWLWRTLTYGKVQPMRIQKEIG